MIRFKTYIDELEHLPGNHILVIPEEVVEEIGGLKTRVICIVNDIVEYQTGLVALGGGNAYITITKARMKKVGAELGSEVEVKLEKDNSKYGTPMPKEFEEVLRQDPDGRERFENLSPSKKRYLIQHVSKGKSSQSKIDLAISFLRNLKQYPEGKEDLKEVVKKS